MVQKTLDQLLISLPEVKAGKGIWQNPFHEFDVYDHSLDFVKHIKDLTDDLNLIVAGYLHDIGKPVCKIPTYKDGVLQEKEPGKPYHRFKNHEHVGANMVREMNSNIFLQYGLDKIKIADLVECHFIPMKNIREMRKTTTFDNFMEKYNALEREFDGCNVSRKEIMTMFLADKLAQGKGCTDKHELFAIRNAVLGKDVSLKEIYNLQQKEYHTI